MSSKLPIEYARTKDLLAIFGVCKKTFYRWRRAKAVPQGRKVRGRVMYSVSEFVAAVERNGLKVDPVALELFKNQSPENQQ